jgi:hypothetical protein
LEEKRMIQQRTQSQALAALAARIANLTGGNIRLYQDDGFVPDAQSVLADLAAHEANYTGYAAGGIALAGPLGPYIDGENRWSENYPTVIFQPTGPVLVSNEIRGVFFEDSAAALDEVWIFDEPITMATVLDKVLVDAKFTESAPAETVP